MKHIFNYSTLCLSLLLGTLVLVGCDDIQSFLTKMKLTQEQSEKAKPILSTYLEKQNKLLEKMTSQRPQGPPPRQSQGSSRSMERPDRSQMKEQMENKHNEMEAQFEANDNNTAEKLAVFLDTGQIDHFKRLAKDYRQKKMEEMKSQQQDGQGKGKGRRGGPPGGGRMGGF